MFAAGKTAAVTSAANYIEDVFSTYLYTGNGTTQTITNGINLAGKGGMTWCKNRAFSSNHQLADTVTGFTGAGLIPNFANALGQVDLNNYYSNGFDLQNVTNTINRSGDNCVSWTFRKQPKFFDVVTYTGNGVTGHSISHNLGSVPGCIIIKCTSTTGDWFVYHTSAGATNYLLLDTTDVATAGGVFNNFTPTSTAFQVTGVSTNTNGATYVAYIFANNAGGFGLTGTDNVITCGSYTGTGVIGNAVTLGFEPQWLLIKASTSAQEWSIYDSMRGLFVGTSTNDNRLTANTQSTETAFPDIAPTATGFACENTGTRVNGSGITYIYIAIRRGPMKVPTDATKVFAPTTTSGTTGTVVTTNSPVDMQITRNGSVSANTSNVLVDRLRGISTNATEGGAFLGITSTNAESTTAKFSRFWDNISFQVPTVNGSGISQIYWNFQRAPNFFDVVCYTGDGSASRSLAHNLGVAPELAIFKTRNAAGNNWIVFQKDVSTAGNATLSLNTTGAITITGNYFPNGFASSVTATTLNNIGSSGAINGSTNTFVAYLFATCPGVSKVGSYTGTGTLTTINCGFTGGARFVLIKRTDSTSNWFVWDTARGMVAGTDPSLAWNDTPGQVNANSVYTIATGFQLLASPSADVNTNGGSYIYLAVA